MFQYKYSALMLAITASVTAPVYASSDSVMSSNTVSPYVVGGIPIAIDPAHNFMASLRNNKAGETPFCGATIINEQWVLTAAHCVVQGSGESAFVIAPSDITISAGLIDNTNPQKEHLFSATHIVVHPDFSPVTVIKETTVNNQLITEVVSTALDNDVALIRVDRKFIDLGKVTLSTLSQTQLIEQRLKIEWEQANDPIPTDNRPENIEVLGWGAMDPSGSSDSASDTLQQAMLSLFPIDLCYDRIELEPNPGLIIDSPANITKLCALPPVVIEDLGDGAVVGADSCKGDSGGPILATDSEGNQLQVGIVSGGTAGNPVCGSMTRPGFYARVGNYTNWIVDNSSKVPSNSITPPDFIIDQDGGGDDGCNDSISANNCNIGKDRDSGGSLGFMGLLLLCSGAFFRRFKD